MMDQKKRRRFEVAEGRSMKSAPAQNDRTIFWCLFGGPGHRRSIRSPGQLM
jgi:hypothetical protein